MSKPKAVYKAEDDSDHPSAAAAENWNLLLQAQQAFNQAAKSVSYRLGKTAMTADGQAFDWGVCRDYWWVAQGYFSRLPSLHRVSFYHYSCRVELDRHSPEQQVVIYSHEQYDTNDKFQKFKINELYALESNARAAHLAACEERLKELTAEVEKMRGSR